MNSKLKLQIILNKDQKLFKDKYKVEEMKRIKKEKWNTINKDKRKQVQYEIDKLTKKNRRSHV